MDTSKVSYAEAKKFACEFAEYLVKVGQPYPPFENAVLIGWQEVKRRLQLFENELGYNRRQREFVACCEELVRVLGPIAREHPESPEARLFNTLNSTLSSYRIAIAVNEPEPEPSESGHDTSGK